MAFDFIGYFAVPFLTVALSRETALFSTNFSSIRTANHRQGEFLVWSFFSSSTCSSASCHFFTEEAFRAAENGTVCCFFSWAAASFS